MANGPKFIKVLCKNTLLAIGLAAILFHGGSIFLENFFDPCDVETIGIMLAPGKDLKSVVYAVDCGATTSKSTQVAIIRSDEKFSRSKHRPFLVLRRYAKIRQKWIDAKHLEVAIRSNDKSKGSVVLKSVKFYGVMIGYR